MLAVTCGERPRAVCGCRVADLAPIKSPFWVKTWRTGDLIGGRGREVFVASGFRFENLVAKNSGELERLQRGILDRGYAGMRRPPCQMCTEGHNMPSDH